MLREWKTFLSDIDEAFSNKYYEQNSKVVKSRFNRVLLFVTDED